MSLARVFEPLWASMAKQYQAMVGAELKKYGLRYDDLLDQMQDLDTNEALSRLPQEVQDARMQRLKRAMDHSLKHTYLSKELQAKQTPFEEYLYPMVQQVKGEMAEKAQLGTGKPYERQIP